MSTRKKLFEHIHVISTAAAVLTYEVEVLLVARVRGDRQHHVDLRLVHVQAPSSPPKVIDAYRDSFMD